MSNVHCNECGVELPEQDASPSMVGWLCSECAANRPERADIEQTYRNYALYSCVCAAASYFINPVAVLTIAAVILGTRALTYPGKFPEEEREFLADSSWVKWVAAGSIVAALAPLVVGAVQSLMGA